MKKSEAIKEAAIDLNHAGDTVAAAIQILGRIKTQAIDDGFTRSIIQQIKELDRVEATIRKMSDHLDWDVDDEKDIATEMRENF